ncbi:tryptase gamma-like [Acanthaster planci]|uniref:Tryptase gamma-like n=1 Tax=Acanthaster planci TaxID=133434 RepID=A0A8B7YCP3_ACAPL|nr:tryptase gamma-like [Acanthaster planci]
MRIFVFFVCLSLALAFSPDRLNEGKSIVGGIEAPLKSRPYQVALFISSTGGFNGQYCGGTLVSKRWVVSAAHCAGGPVYVGLGYHDLDVKQQIIKGTWYAHPSHNSKTYDNDIALIYLSSSASLSDAVQPIKIASSGSDVSSGKKLLVSGWGRLSSGGYFPSKLRQAVVYGVSRSSCNSDYSGIITNNMICAAASGKDSCQGDSGGPIVSSFSESSHSSSTTLEGIVSWGYGCASSYYPGVYTRVAKYCDWIATFSPDRLNEGKLIVGGVEAPYKSRPYQVALFASSTGGVNSQYCGGTLISKRWVVSAAHCAGGSVYVGLGYHDLEVKQQIIKGSWYIHPSYNSNNYDNDIALVYLSASASLSSAVQPIRIASSGSDVSSGEKLLVSGWGALSSGGSYPSKLRQAVVYGVSRSSCNSDYGGSITRNMICAAASGKDSCQGDSGGPIVSNFYENSHSSSTTLEGIVSWGNGCASPYYPGVYTRVAKYCDWIAYYTSNVVTC